MTLADRLDAVFTADRALYEAEARLLAEPPGALGALLLEAVAEARALPDRVEASRRLRRLADLSAQVEGPRPVRALLEILDDDDPAARAEAGEALLHVAYERFKEVARAVERALDEGRGGTVMEELPFVLTEVRDPDPMPLLLRLLRHAEADVVAATVEALVDFGDPAALPHLEALKDDPREVHLEELEDGPLPLGDLVRDALDQLS